VLAKMNVIGEMIFSPAEPRSTCWDRIQIRVQEVTSKAKPSTVKSQRLTVVRFSVLPAVLLNTKVFRDATPQQLANYRACNHHLRSLAVQDVYILKMKVAYPSETSVDYKSTWRNISEALNLQLSAPQAGACQMN
jgi:hypothetical protein